MIKYLGIGIAATLLAILLMTEYPRSGKAICLVETFDTPYDLPDIEIGEEIDYFMQDDSVEIFSTKWLNYPNNRVRIEKRVFRVLFKY